MVKDPLLLKHLDQAGQFASLNSWSSTTKYPIGTWNQSCVVYSGFVYCIGGRPDGGATSPTNAVYFAQLLPGGGLGSWSSTTNNYRTSIDNQSCVVDSGFVYCIGGVVSFSSITSAVCFAPLLTTGGVGTWMPTTSYPTNIDRPSCVVYSGFVYCITGVDGSGPFSNAVHFAQLLPGGGLGSWSSTTNNYPLPILEQSCVVDSGFVYCFGGYNFGDGCVSQCGPPDFKTAVYFAQLSPSGGVGSWSASTSYPINISEQSCIVDSGFVYCIGGYNQLTAAKNVVYLAPLSSSGVGFWTETTD